MDPGSSFRQCGVAQKGFLAGKPPPQGMFKALRRLHGQNLESRGLNDLTEAFQSFVTRARFFSIGKLRRTWSHSAAEFMKYRRLLPMLLADGQAFDNDEAHDAFDAVLSFQTAQRDERRVQVGNVSPRVTASQLQAFFSKYGKVTHCSLPREDVRRASAFATLPKTPRNLGVAVVSFRKVEEAQRAKAAPPEDLKFYDQVMTVSEYVSRKKAGKGVILSDEKSFDDSRLSRASSNQSLTSQMSTSTYEVGMLSARGQAQTPNATFCLAHLPSAALERVLAFLPVCDTIRLERVNKAWMEASVKSWRHVNALSFSREADGRGRCFSKQSPLLTSHLRAILRRCGAHLASLDLSGVVHLLDDKAPALIAKLCPGIVALDLSGVSAGWQALAELGDALTALTRLAYRDMPNATDKHMWFLIRGSSKSLRFVDFRGCRRFRGRCFRLFGHSLEQLYLDGCSRVDELAIEDLCTCAPQLKELRLNECYKLTDSSISLISRHLSDLQVCRTLPANLQAITLCGDAFTSVSTSGLTHLARISELVEIALDFNALVSDELLAHLVEGARGLRCVSLANAGSDQALSTRGLRSLARLADLEQVDLSSIAAVRAPLLLELSERCPNLELLQLRNCVYLADDGVMHAAKARRLRHLDLSGSILVTSTSIQELIKAFPQEKGLPTVTVVVGGTAADATQLRVRQSRVAVDFSDYSALVGIASSPYEANATGLPDPHGRSMSLSGSLGSRMAQSMPSPAFRVGGSDDEDDSEDDFEVLTAQRSFYIDAICGEDDSPDLENEKEVLEWAAREAKNLGLIQN